MDRARSSPAFSSPITPIVIIYQNKTETRHREYLSLWSRHLQNGNLRISATRDAAPRRVGGQGCCEVHCFTLQRVCVCVDIFVGCLSRESQLASGCEELLQSRALVGRWRSVEDARLIGCCGEPLVSLTFRLVLFVCFGDAKGGLFQCARGRAAVCASGA